MQLLQPVLAHICDPHATGLLPHSPPLWTPPPRDLRWEAVEAAKARREAEINELLKEEQEEEVEVERVREGGGEMLLSALPGQYTVTLPTRFPKRPAY